MRSLRTILLATAAGAASLSAPAQAAAPGAPYQHVLVISVDGMHAVDLTRYIDSHPASNFAKLANHGIVYPNAFTTGPSDSVPGMLAQFTGATAKTAGLFYDDAYDRKEYPSVNTYLSQGLPDAGCTGKPGAEITNFEDLDKSYDYATGLTPDITGGGTLGKVYTQLDPNSMQRHIVAGKCVPVYPHQYVRANTVFELIRDAGLYTAWSDKHPAYEFLAGPSGKGLDELFAPEINAQDTLDQNAAVGDDYTKSFKGVRTYDSIKVRAVLNWINGFNSVGDQKLAGAPAIFGMNFQSVSVGQKLAKAGAADFKTPTLTGGYLDSNATPGDALTIQLKFIDDSLGKMRAALKAEGLEKSTLIIVSAKHGQSPIDPKDRVAISDKGFKATPGFGTGFVICDDSALIWLQPDTQKASYAEAKAYLEANATTLHIAQLLDRTSITPLYGDPFKNSRVPDFVAVTDHGAICTGGTKLSEHGGYSDDDRNVALLASAPNLKARVVEDLTYTTQIAPTILAALGLDWTKLDGVQKEGTQILTH